jgi:hypothetical protein
MSRQLAIFLATLLAASVLANAVLGWSYLGARDERTEAIGARDQARAAATACSAGVSRLEDAARTRAGEAFRAMERARGQAVTHQAAAQRILSSAPSVPGDACKSAGDAIDAWLLGRGLK